MPTPSQRSVLRALLIALLVALPVVPAGAVLWPAAPSAPAPSAPTAIASVPHPAVPCPLGYPAYEMVGDGWAPSPNPVYQGNCGQTGQDEAHASLFSTQGYSGARFTLPVHLPGAGTAPGGQDSVLYTFNVGLVVRGDNRSEWRQSYAEATFSPVGGGSQYTLNVSVWALVNSSRLSGGTCPWAGGNFSWNSSYFCEIQDTGNGSGVTLTSAINGGDWVNVTFVGAVGNWQGTELFVNDSTTPSASENYRFISNVTGSYNFTPYYNASCDSCVLQWGMSYGLGVGYTLCPRSTWIGDTMGAPSPCVSYNQTLWDELPSYELGVPRFWNGTAYGGEYAVFAPESTSGACNAYAPAYTVAACVYFNPPFGGTDYYPIFSFNGSSINFGVSWPWTTHDFGGALLQYSPTGTVTDLTPFWVDAVKNTSRAGYLASGRALNVSAYLEVWGSVASATVHYTVGSGSWQSVAMAYVNGSSGAPVYTGTIPATGGDGTIRYYVQATDRAGVNLFSANATVVRGPLPTFTVSLLRSGATCGTITFNGTTYPNASTISVQPGYYPVQANGCYPWVFSHWGLSPTLSVGGPYDTSTLLAVSGNGTATAVWRYVRPLDQVALQTNPGSCGTISINGTAHSNGASLLLLDQINYTLAETTCSGMAFGGWTYIGNFTVFTGWNGSRFEPMGNGTLVANFVNSSYAYGLSFYTSPSTCGGVRLAGAIYGNGTTIWLYAGGYPVAPAPCAHWNFSSYTTGGSALLFYSPNGSGNVTVNGYGSITEVNYILTEVTIQTYPSGCGYIQFDGRNYTNGSVVVVQNDSVHTAYAYACSGYYLFAMTGDGGLTVSGNVVEANASGTLLATFYPGVPSTFVAFLTDPSTCGAIRFGGTVYYNSNYTDVVGNSVWSIAALSCPNYGFVRWVTTSVIQGGITIVGSQVYVNHSGSIEAVFRPLVPVFLYTSPATCGAVSLDGVAYPGNTSLELPIGRQYALGVQACAGYRFTGWTNTSTAVIANGTVYFTSGSILTANFAPVLYPVTVTVDPASCGYVSVGGRVATNGTTLNLSAGVYALKPSPCQGYHLDHWVGSGGAAVSGSNLTVNGTGTVSAFLLPVPPTVRLDVPASSYAGSPVGLSAIVGVPLASTNYSFVWGFGDGSPGTTTPANFTSHTFATPGTYTVTVTVTDPFGRTANASAAVVVLAPIGGATSGFWSPINIALVAVLLVLAAAVAVTLLRQRSSASRPPSEESPGLPRGVRTEPAVEEEAPPADPSPLEGDHEV